MKRFLKYTLLSLILLVIVIVAAVAFVTATETGTRLAWHLAHDFLPAGIKIEAVEGRLLGPLIVRGIEYRTNDFHLRVRAGELHWAPRDLWQARALNIELLAVRGLRYTQLHAAPAPRKKKSGPLTLPEQIDLPLDAHLRELRLEDVEYRAARDTESLLLHSAVLKASYVGNQLTIDRLDIDTPLVSLKAQARFTASGAYPVNATLQWKARPPNYPAAVGHTALNGNLRRTVRIGQTIKAPYRAQVRVVVNEPLAEPIFNARLHLDQVTLRAIDENLPPITLSTQARAAGTAEDIELHAQATVEEPKYGTLNLALNGRFADSVVTINKLALTSPEQPAWLHADGSIALGGKPPKVDVQASWQALRWPLSGQAQIESPKGSLDINGTITAVRAQLTAALSGAVLAQAGIEQAQTLSANFRGGLVKQTLAIDEFDVAFVEQQLAALGHVKLGGKQPQLDVQVQWQDLHWPLTGNEPQITSPTGEIAVTGTPKDLRVKLDVNIGEDGRLDGTAKRAGETIALALNWRDLRWPLSGPAQVESAQGSLDVDGTIESLRAELSTALNGSALSSAGVQETQQLRASFRGGFAYETLTIDQFALGLAAQPTQMTAVGQVMLKQRQPVFDLAIGWEQLQWPLTGTARVQSSQGNLTINGPLRNMRAALTARLGGKALPPAGIQQEQTIKLKFDGGFEAQALTIDKFAATFNQQRLTVEGHVALHTSQPTLDLRTMWNGLQWPLAGPPMITSPQGDMVVKGTPEALQGKLNINVGEDGYIQGNVKRAGQIFDVELNWRDLKWPMATPHIASEAGHVSVLGLLRDYRVKLDTRISAPEFTDARIDLAGRGGLEFLDLTEINIEALEGKIGGNARVAWKPALEASAALNAEGLDPSELLADWPGNLGLTLKAETSMEGEQWSVQFEELIVRGRLRDYPLRLNARGAYDDQGLMLDQLHLASGESELQAQGRIGEMLNVAWQVDSPDLAQLLPNAVGQISGEGNAQGPLQRPRIEAHLTGSELRYRSFELQSLNLDANIDVSGAQPSTLDVHMRNGRAEGIGLRRIVLHGEGDPAAHTLSLTARTSTGHADVAVNARLNNPSQPDMRWRFELEKATLKYPQLAAWRLPAPLTGMISKKRAEFSQGCWVSGDARLCVQGEHKPTGIQGEVELTDLAFSYFARLLPPGTRVDGGLSGRAEFDIPAQGQPAATMRLQTTAGRVASVMRASPAIFESQRRGESDGVPDQILTLMSFRPSDVDFEIGAGGLRLDVALRLAEQGGIEMMANVPQGDPPLSRRPLDGRIAADIPDLSFISKLAPNLGRFAGHLRGDVRLAGTLQAPALFGRMALLNGFAAVDQAGLRVKGIRVELIGEGRGGIRLDAVARSGGGMLNVQGQFQLVGENTPHAHVSIKGQEFLAVNTAGARVFISPDLKVAANTKRVKVTGQVRVPRADITPKQLPESAVTVSGDQVIVRPGENDPQMAEAAGIKIYARVRLILGDRIQDGIDGQITDKLDEPEVYIDAFGLTAGLEGELLIIEEPGEPTRGTGELSIVGGEYQAYGQDLVIETGRVLFPGGPISEPGLDVRAVRGDLEGEDIVVGVQVRGSLKQPQFKLFSEPAMAQQEQLAYLVLGHPLDASSGGESSLLARATLALGLKGGNYLAEKFSKKLGVDEIGFESSDTSAGDGEQASLVIGKYLSPRLYIRYGIGLLEPVSTVRLEYAITNSLELVTESSGAQTGGDLIYTIERGR